MTVTKLWGRSGEVTLGLENQDPQLLNLNQEGYQRTTATPPILKPTMPTIIPDHSMPTMPTTPSRMTNRKYTSKCGQALAKDTTNLIVNFLPVNVTEQQLHDMFAQYGRLDTWKVVRHRETHESRGFGFVKFTDEDSARKAISGLNGFVMGMKRIKVAIARPNCSQIQGTNIHVSLLPKSFTDADMMNLFGAYGELIECRVLVDRVSGHTRCQGFVRYDTHENARRALSALSHYLPPGSTQPIRVKLAAKRVDRKVPVVNVRHTTPAPLIVSQQPMYLDQLFRGAMLTNPVSGPWPVAGQPCATPMWNATPAPLPTPLPLINGYVSTMPQWAGSPCQMSPMTPVAPITSSAGYHPFVSGLDVFGTPESCVEPYAGVSMTQQVPMPELPKQLNPWAKNFAPSSAPHSGAPHPLFTIDETNSVTP